MSAPLLRIACNSVSERITTEILDTPCCVICFDLLDHIRDDLVPYPVVWGAVRAPVRTQVWEAIRGETANFCRYEY
jgi:hypothetical protein